MSEQNTIPSIEAHATMAAAWMWSAVERWVEEGWENFAPDIGQYDFEAITDLMYAMLPTDPKRDKVEAAYQRFADRADREMNDEVV